jgi:hypothetical protein
LIDGATAHGAERVRDATGMPILGRPVLVSITTQGAKFGVANSESIESARGFNAGNFDHLACVSSSQLIEASRGADPGRLQL